MGPRNSFLVVFVLCAISLSVEARPSKTPSSAAASHDNQRQNAVENNSRLNQTADYRNINKGAGRPYGNHIMMREKPKIKDTDKAIKYMYKYGYMPVPNHPASKMPEMTPDKMEENTKKMQMMMGVPMTGELDDVTMAMIDKPRCGVHDPVDSMQIETSPQNFVHYGQKWPRNNITYRIMNFPYNLNRNDAYASIQQAFKVWSDVTPLTFTEQVAGHADIYLKFGRYEHGDYYPFDGRGGTLAHAFLPQSGQGDLEGDVHFDDDELFTYHSYQGSNLFYVAAHEIGHALGLHHSLNPSALMAPFINPYDPQFTLHPDDIAGIQDLYGVESTTANPDDTITLTQSKATLTRSTTSSDKVNVTTSPPPTEVPSFTHEKITSLVDSTAHSDVTVSATTEKDTTPMSSAATTVFSPDDSDTSSSFLDSSSSWSSSSDYYASEQDGRCPPYYSFFANNDGHQVGPDVADGPDDCDFNFDAVTSYRGEVFAFKSDHYWRITRDFGFISPLNGAEAEYFFQSFPNDIDAAYEQYLTSKLLVFKGANYFVYNGLSLESGPQPITNLDPSLPSDLDAVLTWGEWHKTYFFKHDLVWRYDERHGRIDDGWPWSIEEIWTGVPNYLTSAFRWGDYTYFLRGNRLYAYDDYCYYVNPLDNPKSFAQEFIGGSCPYL